MFKCEQCGTITKPGETQHKKVIKVREKNYKNEDKYGNIKTTKGFETVKEINICEECFQKTNGGK